MKKLIAILLAMVMCFSMVSVALADETAVATISWEEVEEAAAQIDPDAEFYEMFELDDNQICVMWVPSVFEAYQLDDEEIENGMIGVLMTEDESCAVEIFQMDIGEGTLEDFAAAAAEEYTDIELGIVNDIPVLTMIDPENDMALILFATDAGVAVAFGFYPISDEGFATVANLMMASIMVEEIA